MGVKCFLVTDTDRYRATLRRYSSSADMKECPGHGYHNANGTLLGIFTWEHKDGDRYKSMDDAERALKPSDDDPRWPRKCDHCAYVFTSADAHQVFTDSIYVDAAGKEYSLRDRVPGMMWFADWWGEYAYGPDGHCLVVTCPGGGEWVIDGPASNCTMKNDTGPFDKAHRCWVRHGTPPNVTVDKNGRTCSAGGGSIQAGNYHGFLRNGEFT